MKKGKKLLVLGIILTYVCVAAACTSRDNTGNSGNMAGTGAASDTGTNTTAPSAVPGTDNSGDHVNGTDNSTANDNLNNTNNGTVTDTTGTGDSLLNDAGDAVGNAVDDAGNAVGNVVDDVADGVSDVTDDLVGGGENSQHSNQNSSSATESTAR